MLTLPAVPIVRDLNANFVDDDELQAALARSRQAKLRKTKKVSPEELAKRSENLFPFPRSDGLKFSAVTEQRVKEEEADNQELIKNENPDHEDGGLTFDETSEFVQAVGSNPIVKPKKEPAESTISRLPEPVKTKAESRDVSMAPGDVALDELEAGEVQVKDEEDEDYDMHMLDEIENALKKTEEEEHAALEAGGDGVGTFL